MLAEQGTLASLVEQHTTGRKRLHRYIMIIIVIFRIRFIRLLNSGSILFFVYITRFTEATKSSHNPKEYLRNRIDF